MIPLCSVHYASNRPSTARDSKQLDPFIFQHIHLSIDQVNAGESNAAIVALVRSVVACQNNTADTSFLLNNIF